jgi:hypothetical protein
VLLVFVHIYFGVLFFLFALSLVSFGSAVVSLMQSRSSLMAFFKIVLGCVALVPAGFLVKSLFAHRQLAKGYEIEILPDEHPRLFRFLECVCDDVDSPMPEGSFHMVIAVFREAYEAVSYVLDQAELAKFPALANMPCGEPIRSYILKGDLPSKPTHFDES